MQATKNKILRIIYSKLLDNHELEKFPVILSLNISTAFVVFYTSTAVVIIIIISSTSAGVGLGTPPSSKLGLGRLQEHAPAVWVVVRAIRPAGGVINASVYLRTSRLYCNSSTENKQLCR